MRQRKGVSAAKDIAEGKGRRDWQTGAILQTLDRPNYGETGLAQTGSARLDNTENYAAPVQSFHELCNTVLPNNAQIFTAMSTDPMNNSHAIIILRFNGNHRHSRTHDKLRGAFPTLNIVWIEITHLSGILTSSASARKAAEVFLKCSFAQLKSRRCRITRSLEHSGLCLVRATLMHSA